MIDSSARQNAIIALQKAVWEVYGQGLCDKAAGQIIDGLTEPTLKDKQALIKQLNLENQRGKQKKLQKRTRDRLTRRVEGPTKNSFC